MFSSFADNHNIYDTLELIKKDLKTLEKAVYSNSSEFNNTNSASSSVDSNSEDVLTRHLLKLSEIENQFQELTNKFEEINFKLDKLSNRLSKVQSDNQLRFQDLETALSNGETINLTSKKSSETDTEILPGSSQPQDLGSISYKDNSTSDTTQKIQSVETTATIVTETFQAEEKILPDVSAPEQYEFATSFLKVGDYPTAERAFREFVISNPDHKLAGNAQYWYAETFRIRQLYTDAASAYLEGYQKYPKGEKAPINLLKLGVSMIQIGEKDQGCKMISGVEKQYPDANQSVIQKAKYESQKFECKKKKIPKIYKSKILNQKVNKIFKKFEKSFKIDTNFIVAVSGGADSLALAFLTKVYALKKNLNPRYFIVDHKLRKESTYEAYKVKKILKSLKINSQVLTWKGKKPVSNIQSLARSKRYELLFFKCKKLKISNLVLGHHIDDLIENFFLRMARGSGLKGLVSLGTNTQIKNINLIRPLIKFDKRDLIFLSKFIFNFYVDDPTNDDIKFKRIKVRNLIKEFEDFGLDKKKFQLTIENLKKSDQSIKFYVEKNKRENSIFNYRKNELILKENFFDNSNEIIFRSLSDLIHLVGKKPNFVRGKKIENILNKIKERKLRKETLGGCVIKMVNHTVILTKEG